MVNFESMSALSFSFVDVLVVAVVLISAWFAAYRGFVRESLSIFALVAAAFAALYFGPAVVKLLHGLLSGWAAVIAAYAGVFVVVMLPLSFMSHRFAENVRQSPVSGIDRVLGSAFGIVRGLVIVGLAYLVFSMLVPIPKQPDWMTRARLLPVIQSSGQVLLALLPDEQRKAAHREAARHAGPDAETAQKGKTGQQSYSAKDRRALDSLIEATANGGEQKP